MRECDQFESWAKETEGALADNAATENVPAFRKKFDVCNIRFTEFKLNYIKIKWR